LLPERFEPQEDRFDWAFDGQEDSERQAHGAEAAGPDGRSQNRLFPASVLEFALDQEERVQIALLRKIGLHSEGQNL